MAKIYAVIHCDAKGNPYQCRVTNGEWVQEIPVKNSSVTTCKKALKQMHKGCVIWVSQEVKSE